MKRLWVVALVLGACLSGVQLAVPGSADAAGSSLRRGSRGDSVKILEQRLHALGLLRQRAVNRYFGSPTTRAVRRFQGAHGLPVTGRVATSDWDAIEREVQPPAWSAPPWPAPGVIGHRGAGGSVAPENSVAAWRLATGTAQVLEFDVRLTADRRLVVMHDATLDRTTSCTGAVNALTLEALGQCSLADGSPVPTYEQAVSYAASAGLQVAPDLKPGDLTDAELEQFVTVLRQYGFGDSAYVQSFVPAYFPRLRALAPDLRMVYLADTTAPLAQTVLDSGAEIVGAKLGTVDASHVAGWHQAGLQVWLWTSRDLAGLQQTWTLGADAAVTDIPAEAQTLYGPAR